MYQYLVTATGIAPGGTYPIRRWIKTDWRLEETAEAKAYFMGKAKRELDYMFDKWKDLKVDSGSVIAGKRKGNGNQQTNT